MSSNPSLVHKTGYSKLLGSVALAALRCFQYVDFKMLLCSRNPSGGGPKMCEALSPKVGSGCVRTIAFPRSKYFNCLLCDWEELGVSAYLSFPHQLKSLLVQG
jgi:hypothetical protein